MTVSDFQRAQLVAFAFREAGKGGSVDQMKGICYCIRNRVRAGWHDGNWLAVLENAHHHAAHETDDFQLTTESRELQRLLREADDIYFGSGDAGTAIGEGDGLSLEGSLTERNHEKLFWVFLNRPIRPWFQKTILANRAEHKSRTQMGTLMFIE